MVFVIKNTRHILFLGEKGGDEKHNVKGEFPEKVIRFIDDDAVMR